MQDVFKEAYNVLHPEFLRFIRNGREAWFQYSARAHGIGIVGSQISSSQMPMIVRKKPSVGTRNVVLNASIHIREWHQKADQDVSILEPRDR